MLWGVTVAVATATDTATAMATATATGGDGAGKWLVADLSGLLVENLAKVIPGLAYDERGLLGVAFDPQFKHNGLLYTFTSEDPTRSTRLHHPARRDSRRWSGGGHRVGGP